MPHGQSGIPLALLFGIPDIATNCTGLWRGSGMGVPVGQDWWLDAVMLLGLDVLLCHVVLEIEGRVALLGMCSATSAVVATPSLIPGKVPAY